MRLEEDGGRDIVLPRPKRRALLCPLGRSGRLCPASQYANTPCTILTPRARSMFGHLRRMQALDQFAYAIVETPVGKKCVQIGTHGDGLSAETEEMSLSPGAPQSWTPGACPADYGELRLFV